MSSDAPTRTQPARENPKRTSSQTPGQAGGGAGPAPEQGQGQARHAQDDDMILPLCSIFRRFLKRQGLKFTTERALILEAVLSKEGVFEAEHLLDEMRTAGRRVSKATIYRTLKHLRDANIISEVLIDSRQSHYELCFGREPKGHLVCVETNQIIEFPAHELVELRERICKKYGFDPVSHRFVIYGVSPEAKKQEQAEDEKE